MLELWLGILIGATLLGTAQKTKKAIRRQLYAEVESILQDKSGPRR